MQLRQKYQCYVLIALHGKSFYVQYLKVFTELPHSLQ